MRKSNDTLSCFIVMHQLKHFFWITLNRFLDSDVVLEPTCLFSFRIHPPLPIPRPVLGHWPCGPVPSPLGILVTSYDNNSLLVDPPFPCKIFDGQPFIMIKVEFVNTDHLTFISYKRALAMDLIVDSGTAPTIWSAFCPFLKNIKVGILVMR